MNVYGGSIFFLKADSLEYWILQYCNTGILEYWNTGILGSINSIHFITVYTIHWGYILCTFFHIHIHYFTHILYMYLLILYMHTFTHVLLIYFILVLYTYYIYYTNSMFTYTLNSCNYYTHFLQCLRSIVTLQLLCILYKHYQFLCT